MTDLSLYTQQIRERVNVSEVIGRDVKLARKGHEFHGLCPFHSEKSPSFTVNDHKGFYHCFGCGAHGDVIQYVMQRHNLDFKATIHQLAETAGITIQEVERQPEKAPPPDLYKILEFSCQWFETSLQQSRGEGAREYLAQRGFSQSTQTQFRLGFAPDPKQGGGSLSQTLTQKGFDKALILKAGVLIQTDDGGRIYDRFRGRVMFPIFDVKGRVLAFGGRIIGSKDQTADQAKYINSSETPLFHKGHVLYNYHQAFKHINKDIPPILVEGYCDVISLYQGGFTTALAPLGTALTEQQLNLLWRRHPSPILCFDGDQAGVRASFRAIERALPLLTADKSLKICYLPAGEDPDSFLKARGPSAFKGMLDQSLSLIDSMWTNIMKIQPAEALSTPEGKAKFKRQVFDLVKTIQDPDMRKFYELDVTERLNRLWYQEKRFLPSLKKGKPQVNLGSLPLPRISDKKNTLAHKILLATLITHPTLLKEVFEKFAGLEFQKESWQNMRQCMLDYSQENLQTLKDKLHELGFASELDALFDKELFLHAPFAMHGSDPDLALERWQDIWQQTTWKQAVKNDLKQAQEDTKKSFDDQSWQKMKTLKNIFPI
ncbi:DNA primase [Candidatus Finniella inopinata]|uniref:DNA primase n=1 Tax=Candidatus Finniella inopinata TaxID=1696036 RepID=A0A4Q7DGF2_9PROT|nr:DNA primase [Candidatus Finniella inopinata]RZI45883.1 DNA primase [Candidatus Finniella inopinata]